MSYLTRERLEALRSEYNQRNRLRNGLGRYPRQKMLPEYQFIYPWVIPDEQDLYFAFCTVCECRLSAKRSDLGKHESSNKHKDNVSKKGITPVAANTTGPSINSHALRLHHGQQVQMMGESSAESDDDNDKQQDYDGDIYIKQEPVVELAVTTNSDNNGDEYEDEHSEENVSAAKRRISETDSQSQHSSIISALDYLPVQVTVGSASSGQRFSIRELPPAGTYSSNAATINKAVTVTQQYATPESAQAPCKITIKKITAPVTPRTPAQVTSTARITPVCGTMGITQNTAQQLQSEAATTVMSAAHNAADNTLVKPPVRDSFELFFDSICASVKALPPKLATEGKIRVMQLIGELELRAITERENENAYIKTQQNSAVASTTK